MHDNKLRLSADVLEKAEQIAEEWGLKNARAAVEAVFRKYADEYLYGRQQPAYGQPQMSGQYVQPASPLNYHPPHSPSQISMPAYVPSTPSLLPSPTFASSSCEAVDELDGLLSL
ncbi:hypothetical protein [Alkalinema sp. FACHB-956]|uniref:hypothetical protein n=1 Tax=Alkalinema sp. FACHB-956 TaxID=2692768 RepID=UPI0016860F45|nr:hypothetical protein [Alkalinema sp. FACHB-956]MBD2328785.1 hypothetical protein [Alkalinema sp. FACHB-956]